MSLTAVVKISVGAFIVVPARSCPLPLPSSSSCSQQARADPLPPPPPTSLTSKCQHISLLTETITSPSGAPKLTHSIITVMVILIRRGAAPQGKRCTVNYTLAFWMNWLSDTVQVSLTGWTGVFFSPIIINSFTWDPETESGISHPLQNFWNFLQQGLYIVFKVDHTSSSVKSSCNFILFYFFHFFSSGRV